MNDNALVVVERSPGQEQPQAFYDQWYCGRIDPVALLTDRDFVYGHLLRVIRGYLRPSASALDYGCGDGVVALFAAAQGCDVLGLDFSPKAVERATAGAAAHGITRARFQTGDFTRSGFLGPFDVVWAIEVIEHVEDDAELVRWLADQLRAGGICILSTRLVDDPLHRLRKRLKGRDWVDDSDGHVRRYSASGLDQLVRSAGLRVVSTATAEGLLRMFCYKHSVGGLAFRILRWWSWIQAVADHVDAVTLRWFGGSQIVVVTRKPAADAV